MAKDGDFVKGTGDLIQQFLYAIRRGQLRGPYADQINISITELVGPTDQTTPPVLQRVAKRFAVPQHFNLRTKAPIMAVFGIRGDMGTKVEVEFDNIAGTAVPAPTGTPTVTSSNTAVANVTIDADGTGVDIVPTQPPQTGVTFTLTYTDSNVSFSQDCTILADLVATQGHFLTATATEFPLPASSTTTPTPDPAAPATPVP